jgi:putative transcriptional regulator
MRQTAQSQEASLPKAAIRPEEVRAIRYRLKQSQSEFALMIGVSVPTLQGWEEGRRHPDGPADALLRVAARNPKIVARALGRA